MNEGKKKANGTVVFHGQARGERGGTFDGTISTAGEGRCGSLSGTMLTQWAAVLSCDSKPARHCESSDGDRISMLLI